MLIDDGKKYLYEQWDEKYHDWTLIFNNTSFYTSNLKVETHSFPLAYLNLEKLPKAAGFL